MSDGRAEVEQGDEDRGVGEGAAAADGGAARADESAEGAASEPDEAVVAQVNADLAAVDQALERLDAGSYGFCQICGEAIADEDLEATPTMTLCADHAEHREVPGTGS